MLDLSLSIELKFFILIDFFLKWENGSDCVRMLKERGRLSFFVFGGIRWIYFIYIFVLFFLAGTHKSGIIMKQKGEENSAAGCTWPAWLMPTDRWKFSTGSQPEENVGRNEVAKVTRIRLVEWSNQFVPLLHLNNFVKKNFFYFRKSFQEFQVPRWDLSTCRSERSTSGRQWPRKMAVWCASWSQMQAQPESSSGLFFCCCDDERSGSQKRGEMMSDMRGKKNQR